MKRKLSSILKGKTGVLRTDSLMPVGMYVGVPMHRVPIGYYNLVWANRNNPEAEGNPDRMNHETKAVLDFIDKHLGEMKKKKPELNWE